MILQASVPRLIQLYQGGAIKEETGQSKRKPGKEINSNSNEKVY
jgi:hypothetical protein